MLDETNARLIRAAIERWGLITNGRKTKEKNTIAWKKKKHKDFLLSFFFFFLFFGVGWFTKHKEFSNTQLFYTSSLLPKNN